MKACQTCKFLSRSTDHLATDYLKEKVREDKTIYTCISGKQFTDMWAFGKLLSSNDCFCAGEYYEPRNKVKKFWFNRNGICLNPDKTEVGNSKKYRFTYSVCARRNEWYWSTHYKKKGTGTGCGGGGFSPGPGSLKNNENPNRRPCSSEQEAVFKAAQYLLKKAKDFNEDSELKKIKELLARLVQANEPPKKAAKGYPGNKGSDGVYHRIINLFPPHLRYFELFLGSGQILRRKKPAPCDNIGIEINNDVIEKYTSVYPESARIRCMSAFDYLETFSSELEDNDNLFYLDPPYPLDSRRSGAVFYRYEMTNLEHKILLQTIVHARAMIAVSSYENGLYDSILTPEKGWYKTKFNAMTRRGVSVECVYHNYPVPEVLHQYDYLGKDKTDRQRIGRKIKRWADRLRELPALERNAIVEQLLQARQK